MLLCRTHAQPLTLRDGAFRWDEIGFINFHWSNLSCKRVKNVCECHQVNFREGSLGCDKHFILDPPKALSNSSPERNSIEIECNRTRKSIQYDNYLCECSCPKCHYPRVVPSTHHKHVKLVCAFPDLVLLCNLKEYVMLLLVLGKCLVLDWN